MSTQAGSRGEDLVALVLLPDAAALAGPDLPSGGQAWQGGHADGIRLATQLETDRHPRWVLWSAQTVRPLVAAGVPLARCWDLAEVHRLLAGGWVADPAVVWAVALGLDPAQAARPVPARPGGPDLFSALPEPGPSTPPEAGPGSQQDIARWLDEQGQLRAEVVDPRWPDRPDRALVLAHLAQLAQRGQADRLAQLADRAVHTAHAESAAAILCLELERDGLPVDRGGLERLIGAAAGPRPADEQEATAIRGGRDQAVLVHAPPGHEHTDLRNPAQVKALLTACGVRVTTTRKGELQPYRHAHPVVGALLDWRADERIATTYGYRWVDEHIGPDDRLRGAWTACDGAAGRMTAQHGLLSLPATLRPGVAAHRGRVFVRADLGQVEPRVLAVVSGDRELAAATAEDDLYAPVAARLHVERSVAKVAVLAAMYGQRSGVAAQALAGLERAYPVAMGFLDHAYQVGVAAGVLRTYGGRRLPLQRDDAEPPAAAAARGRYARNAVVQGPAAELFKAWAATVRHAVAPAGAQIVLCLHDELLVHTPRDRTDEVVAAVADTLTDSARRWSGGAPVRFVAEIEVVDRWSDAS